ncbi:hypothetical protein GIB67_001082 [Kingdonia uniflora]|uniref:Uncharacterized protein n=1 Tax=Kingdonia uniflora TaxID=39325 RepID=A0A7J7MG01_9MAGN|nr:hypothetical protein GIB67_001082 [Kingdonia uniflora]
MFGTPRKSLREAHQDVSYNSEDIIDDYELAQRKAEESALRRYEATKWVRQMDHGASKSLPEQPTDEKFCLILRNGLILCNILNRVNPGAVSKVFFSPFAIMRHQLFFKNPVVENPVITVESTDGAAQSAIQYFENMRNFLVAVGEMKLLTFEASDIEKGGSSGKVVDCILCLKGYYEWKQAGGIGIWRYGGTVKIVSSPNGSPLPLSNYGSSNELFNEYNNSDDKKLLEFLHFSENSLERAKATDALGFIFDRFGLGIFRAYLTERKDIDDTPLEIMLVDNILRKVVKDFTSFLVSHSNQLGLLLKEKLYGETVTNAQLIEAITKYLDQRTCGCLNDFSIFCICGGKSKKVQSSDNYYAGHVNGLDHHQELEELKSVFRQTRLEVNQVHSNWAEELKRLEHHVKDLKVVSSSYHIVLEENRLLYNQVQDLKGSIRVYCRVRPFLRGQLDEPSAIDYIGENGNIMIVNPHKQGKYTRKVFSFNKVFGGNVTQQEVFADTQPLIKSVLDGFNVCIFAYGQTGSGKTYTMSGPDITTDDTWGVNYRTLRDLFKISKDRIHVITYEVTVQMIEIYNEQVRDLLVSDGSNRRYPFFDVSLRDVLALMRIGQKNRAVGATALNERSSRSHSILTVHVQGKDIACGSILRGCLHLVDLAGSERVDKSEAVGDRLREAQHINKSLSALGDVISSLAQKNKHIPYRNSKLTQVLQDSLGGQAKTLMFVHINPELNSIGETISTLKFAERVASIELGAARLNKETGEIRELKEENSNLKLALERKEAELEQLKGQNICVGAELQKVKAFSPLHLPRTGVSATVKLEITQRPLDVNDARSMEVQSCSSGKQKRPRFPSKYTDRNPSPHEHFFAEQGAVNSTKPRSPSPPLVRRPMSTDRGCLIKSRLKLDTLDNHPIVKLQFPNRMTVNKSVASLSMNATNENNSRGYMGIQSVKSRKAYPNPENVDKQLKQIVNVTQGGIMKSEHQRKTKIKPRLPGRTQKEEIGGKVVETQKSNFPDTENEHGCIRPPIDSGSEKKKLRQNFARDSQNFEPTSSVLAVNQYLMEKHENKLQYSSTRNGNESSNIPTTNLKRSRSSPPGKFTILS